MGNVNKCFLTGRLTRDPDLRQTAGGTAVLGFGLAVNDRRKNTQSGQWEDYTNFIDCTILGARAESLSHILAKGMKVTVEGKLRWSQWEKDGQKRSKIEVLVDEIEIPDKGGSQAAQDAPKTYDGGYPAPDAYSDEEVPF